MVTLSVRSLAVGLVLGASVVVAMGFTASQTALGILRVQYTPHPRDMVQIEEGTPYTVPTGKILVVTAVGTPQLLANGITCLYADNNLVTTAAAVGDLTTIHGSMPTMVAMPQGLTLHSGSVVVPQGPFVGSGRAWGYLAAE